MMLQGLYAFFFVFISITAAANGSCPPSYPSGCECPTPVSIKCTQITQFPRMLNNNTKFLTLEKTTIENITKEDFENLPELTEFKMTDGHLKHIEEGAFQLLKNLETILLRRNFIYTKVFPSGSFANLTKLRSVWLDSNKIQSLPEDMFTNSPITTLSLASTELDRPGLVSISKGLVAKSLTTLYFSGTSLADLTKEQFSGLPNLKAIDLTHCNIENIYADFLKGTKVTKVSLGNNPIVKIDANAMRGDQIVDFSCQNCGLTSEKVFGEESFFLQMTSLDRLDLGHNNISHVPKDAFKGMSSLKTLLLFHNHITSIEENPFISLSSDLDLALQNNPFNCDCNLAWLRKYAEKLKKHVIDDMFCASPTKLARKAIKDLNESQFCCNATVNTTAVCGVRPTTEPTNGAGSTNRPTNGNGSTDKPTGSMSMFQSNIYILLLVVVLLL